METSDRGGAQGRPHVLAAKSHHRFNRASSWADDRAEKICNECNTLGGISFAVKAELKERPYTMVGVLMILSILIFGYGLRNVEVAFMQNLPIEKRKAKLEELLK